MANFQMVISWLNEGKKVRMSDWANGRYICLDKKPSPPAVADSDIIVKYEDGSLFSIRKYHLEDNKWGIYMPTPKCAMWIRNGFCCDTELTLIDENDIIPEDVFGNKYSIYVCGRCKNISAHIMQ